MFLVFLIGTPTSRPEFAAVLRPLKPSASSRPELSLASEGNTKHVNNDQDVSSGTKSHHSSSQNKSGTDAAHRSSSLDQSSSQLSQSSEAEGLPDSSLLTSNNASNQAATHNSTTVSEKQAVDSPADTLSDDSTLGSRHQQNSKLASKQTAVLGALQPQGSLNNATNMTRPQPAVSLRPSVKPAANRDDLIIAMPSSIARMPIVTASRGWRQGVRTFVAFEEEIDLATAPRVFREGPTHHNEVFGVCPDQLVSDPKWHKAGDLRATVTPFLANMTIGPDNFKWMLFGDDDTVFLIDNVLNLLPHLDPTVPYFMTDHLWYPETVDGQELHTHANRRAPRCLPCNYTDPAEQSFRSPPEQYPAPRGCPCNRTALCKADKLGNFGPDCHWVSENSPGFWYFGHGGAGMLMSSALFRQASYDDVVNWIWSLGDISSGDSMLMGAMHVVMGVHPTDPGYGYFRPHVRLFDPGWHGLQVKGEEDENTGDNGNDPLGVLTRLQFALEGKCDEQCEDQLQHVISVHLRTRFLASELSEEEVSASLDNYEGSPDHKPAVYLHHKFQKLWLQYNASRSERSWFDVQVPHSL